MTEVIYFLNPIAPLYMPSHMPEEAVKAFRALGIEAYALPAHLSTQAI